VDTPLSPTQADDLLEREARRFAALGQLKDAHHIAETLEDQKRRNRLTDWVACQMLPGDE
jgi:hypothetical protein